MVFEEFFKKKRIDLAALQAAEGSLFSEFKDHFEQMGEKSFDHTKKYWFNKLRRRFPVPQEIKTEKVAIANPLAEQTITDSLTEPTTPSPKIGFTPKFRATVIPTPAEEKPEEVKAEEDKQPVENVPAKPAFKPRFNPGMVKPKPAESTNAIEEKAEANEATTPPAETPVTKPAFKPRFNAAMVKPKPVAEESPAEEKQEEPTASSTAPTAEIPAAKPAFKQRFNAAMMKPKTVETEEKSAEKEEQIAASAESTEIKPTEETPAAKPAYKPKFNMKNLPKKPEQE